MAHIQDAFQTSGARWNVENGRGIELILLK